MAAPGTQLGSGGLFHISSGSSLQDRHLLPPSTSATHPKGKCFCPCMLCETRARSILASALPCVRRGRALPGLS